MASACVPVAAVVTAPYAVAAVKTAGFDIVRMDEAVLRAEFREPAQGLPFPYWRYRCSHVAW